MRDLGSTNGTWIDGRRLDPGERVELTPGAVTTLGTDESVRFELVEHGAPVVRATELTTATIVQGALDHLQLPDPAVPVWTIFDDGSHWIAERDGLAQRVADQQVLEDAEHRWRLELPARPDGEALETTQADGLGPTPLEICSMRFDVSSDEEHVSVTLRGRGREHPLTPRAFHYTILTLARKRLEDRRAGTAAGEEGWIYADELARKLASTKPKINLDICRARQQLAAAGIVGAGRIIERRPGSQQMRIGLGDLEVMRR